MQRLLLAICLLSVSASNSAPAHSRTLERADLTNLAIKVEQDGRGKKLHVRISMTDSMRVFGAPKSEVMGNTMKVFIPVKLWDAKNKIAGYSAFCLAVPQGVEHITLGNRQCEIWPIDRGATMLSTDEAKARETALKQFNLDCPNIEPFDIGIQISKYDTASITHLKGVDAVYEVVVYYPKGRYIYQIGADLSKILRSVNQKNASN